MCSYLPHLQKTTYTSFIYASFRSYFATFDSSRNVVNHLFALHYEAQKEYFATLKRNFYSEKGILQVCHSYTFPRHFTSLSTFIFTQQPNNLIAKRKKNTNKQLR